MAAATKTKPVFKTLLFGAVTAALYAVVFSHSDMIVQLFSRGGAYAALPIGAVFVFTFAHGTFAHNLWCLLGVEAHTTQPAPRAEVPARRPAQRPRPRLRMSV